MRSVGISVYGPIIAGASVRLDGIGRAPLNSNNYCAFVVGDQFPNTHLFINVPGYRDYSQHLDLKDGVNTDFILSDSHPAGTDTGTPQHPIIWIPNLQPASLPKLVATNHGMQDSTGKSYVWAHVSCFRAEDKIRMGQDINPQLAQIKGTGANGIRVLRDASWFATRAGFQTDSLVTLSGLANAHGLYVQYCVFADWAEVHGKDLAVAQQVWANVVNTVRARQLNNVVLQLCNEGNQHGQDFPFTAFTLPPDILSSRGSNGTGDNPPPPYEQSAVRYNSLGTERRPERAALCTTTVFYAINGYSGEGSFVGTQWDTVVDEPYGIGTSVPPGKDRRIDLGECYLLGLGCRWDPRGLAPGGTAHSDQSLQCEMMDGVTFECVSQFIRGVFDWG